jgi:hypothetical protein
MQILFGIMALLSAISGLIANSIVFSLLMIFYMRKYDIEYRRKAPKPTVIVCAANRLATGLIVCGARHHDPIMNAQIEAAGCGWVGEEQGFIDNKGNFLTREEAHKIAYWNRQIKYRCGGDKKTLFSENLY